MCFIEEEKEAQQARERPVPFLERRRRAQETRVEEVREQEKKWCEEDDDERVRVVHNMEASSSHFQTTDPRAEVEKVVMNGREKRKTGREVPRERVLVPETNGKGKGKGERGT